METKPIVQPSVSENDVHIENSYTIVKWKEMEAYLDSWRQRYPDTNVWRRTNKSLIREWRAHNLLYDCGYERARTKDADLDYPEQKKTKVGFFILSLLYLKGGIYI